MAVLPGYLPLSLPRHANIQLASLPLAGEPRGAVFANLAGEPRGAVFANLAGEQPVAVFANCIGLQ
jgi:hypothetical protein